jgi:hypothetical protein
VPHPEQSSSSMTTVFAIVSPFLCCTRFEGDSLFCELYIFRIAQSTPIILCDGSICRALIEALTAQAGFLGCEFA